MNNVHRNFVDALRCALGKPPLYAAETEGARIDPGELDGIRLQLEGNLGDGNSRKVPRRTEDR